MIAREAPAKLESRGSPITGNGPSFQAPAAESSVALPPDNQRGAVMPITTYLDGAKYDDETKRMMGLAFGLVCTALQTGDF